MSTSAGADFEGLLPRGGQLLTVAGGGERAMAARLLVHLLRHAGVGPGARLEGEGVRPATGHVAVFEHSLQDEVAAAPVLARSDGVLVLRRAGRTATLRSSAVVVQATVDGEPLAAGTRWVALARDSPRSDADPRWVAAPLRTPGEATPFELFVGGTGTRVAFAPLAGPALLRAALGAVALAAETVGAPLDVLLDGLRSFPGVSGRQELLAVARGVRVIREAAPSFEALLSSLEGLAERAPEGELLALHDRGLAEDARVRLSEIVDRAFHADADVLPRVVEKAEAGDQIVLLEDASSLRAPLIAALSLPAKSALGG